MIFALAAVSVVAGVTSAAGAISGGTPLPTANPATATAHTTNAAGAAIYSSIRLTWDEPSPQDNIFGYAINGSSATPGAVLPQTLAVTGVGTLTATVTGLTCGDAYTFTVESVNDQGQTTSPQDPTVATPAPITVVCSPVVVVVQPPPFNFATVDQTIIRHYEEFLHRDPNYTELVIWEQFFFLHRFDDTCALDFGTQPALDPTTTSPVGPYCPNSGAEFDLIYFLVTGQNLVSSGAFDPYQYGQFPGQDQGSTYSGTVWPVIRLYRAYFSRTPDYNGIQYWANKLRGGESLDNISNYFSHSSEFIRSVGKLSNADFVTFIYNNVLGRVEDISGQNFWVGQLDNGRSRGWVMTRFSESAEYQSDVYDDVLVIGFYAALLGRTPTTNELFQAVYTINQNYDNAFDGDSLFVATIRNSPAYAAAVTKPVPDLTKPVVG